MPESTRTIYYAVVAGISVLLAGMVYKVSQPDALAGFEKVGQAFYPDFENPNEATSLEVVVFDEDQARIKDFRIENRNGHWIIPSHHDYPSDAEDRLSKTAASIIGIKRQALASRLESDHEKYNVLDPQYDDLTKLKGRGRRLTLTKGKDEVLADYIIGNAVEGSAGHFYVRSPKEKETYIVALNIDLSAKFADWIEPDLLKLDRDDLTEVVVNKYSIDEVKGQITDQERSRLTRKEFSDPWELDGLDGETERLKGDEITEMVNALDDLKIVGVRPKPRGLSGDLTIDQKIIRSERQLQDIVRDLSRQGFQIGQGENGKGQLLSNEGELTAATKDGVVYTLRFGEIFTGSEFEIETGLADKKSKKGKKKDDDEADEARRSRYLFVSAHFDEKALGDKPVAPTPPVKPAEPKKKEASKKDAKPKKKPTPPKKKPLDANAAADDDTDDAKTDPAKKDAPKKDAPKKDPTKKDDTKKDDAPAEKKPDPQAEYEAAKIKYIGDLGQYESDMKARDEKIVAGRKKAEELNERFAGWYYVISATSFETLRLSRADLVKEKEKPKEKPAEKTPGGKKTPIRKLPSDPTPKKKPETKKPTDAKPPKTDKKPVKPKSSKPSKPTDKKKPAKKPAGAGA